MSCPHRSCAYCYPPATARALRKLRKFGGFLRKLCKYLRCSSIFREA